MAGLTGQIRRGTGMALTAVLWSSDLRGFAERSDRLSSERMIAILNAREFDRRRAKERAGTRISRAQDQIKSRQN